MTRRSRARLRARVAATALAGLAGVASCGDILVDGDRLPGRSVFALTVTGRLLVFSGEDPARVLRANVVSGLPSDEYLLGLDFRPVDGRLYALSSRSRLYVLDTLDARATFVLTSDAPAIGGAAAGIDFELAEDRLRVHSTIGENVRVSLSGAAVLDRPLSYATSDVRAADHPWIVATAFAGCPTGACTSAAALYAIDAQRGALVRVVPANDGTLHTVGALGVPTTIDAGFDIAARDGLALASLTDAGRSRLYRIDLATGAATLVGPIGDSVVVHAVAIAP
ncbi:MAG: DUF4394 domain-containing protein [Gemmatirosa sp.]